jgi:class 3 adenylate cyclase
VAVENADGSALVDIFIVFSSLPQDTTGYGLAFVAKLAGFLEVRSQRVVLRDAVSSTRSKILKLSFTLDDDASDLQGGSFESVCAETVLERLRIATTPEMFLAGLGNVTHLSTPVLNSRCSVSGSAVQQIVPQATASATPQAENNLWLIIVAVTGGTLALAVVGAITFILYRNHKAIQAKLADGAPVGDVFLVFTDIQSSTELWDHMEDVFRSCLEMHDELQRTLIAACGGYEVKTEGDAFLVAFHSGEDAVRFALQLQLELMKLDWPEALLAHPACEPVVHPNDPSRWIYRGVRVRVGIHAGFDHGDDPNLECRRNHRTLRMDYHGRAINRCARVQGLAPGGAIVVTSEIVGDLETAGSSLLRRTDFTDDDLARADAGDGALRGVFSHLGMFRLRDLNADTAVFAVLPLEIAQRPLPNPRGIPGFRDPETGAYVEMGDVGRMHVNPLVLEGPARGGKASGLRRLATAGSHRAASSRGSAGSASLASFESSEFGRMSMDNVTHFRVDSAGSGGYSS